MSAVTADGPGRAGGEHRTGTGAVRLRALSARAARAPLPAAKALAGTVTVFLLSSMLTFGLGAMSGANPGAAVLGITATPADIARMNHQFGLDRPLPVQYASWLGHALTGDFGSSYLTGIPVSQSIAQRLPVDLSIAALALLIAALVGGAAGIAAAVRRGGWIDRAVSAASAAAITVPVFVLGSLLVVLVSVRLRWLPAVGYEPIAAGLWPWLSHVLLPGFALSPAVGAPVARQLRASLAAALEEDYVLGATLRGLSRRRVLFGHALRNALGPALVTLGLAVPDLLGGAVVVESVFALPGLGQYALTGAAGHDTPVIEGVLLTTVALVLVCNLLVDALLGRLRPATTKA